MAATEQAAGKRFMVVILSEATNLCICRIRQMQRSFVACGSSEWPSRRVFPQPVKPGGSARTNHHYIDALAGSEVYQQVRADKPHRLCPLAVSPSADRAIRDGIRKTCREDEGSPGELRTLSGRTYPFAYLCESHSTPRAHPKRHDRAAMR